jgi:hypothetical protein
VTAATGSRCLLLRHAAASHQSWQQRSSNGGNAPPS